MFSGLEVELHYTGRNQIVILMNSTINPVQFRVSQSTPKDAHLLRIQCALNATSSNSVIVLCEKQFGLINSTASYRKINFSTLETTAVQTSIECVSDVFPQY